MKSLIIPLIGAGIIVFVACSMSSCATNRIYRDGKVIASFQSDGKVSYHDKDTSFESEGTLSTATTAGAVGFKDGARAVGAGLAVSGVMGALR